MIYLATPYSHTDKTIEEARWKKVTEVAADFLMLGIHVYSPITHTRPLALIRDLPKNFDFWRDYDFDMLKRCDELVVLMQKGWNKSIGVLEEVSFCMEKRIPVKFIEEVEDYTHTRGKEYATTPDIQTNETG